MKRCFNFRIEGADSVAEPIRNGICGYAIKKVKSNRPTAILLFLVDGSAIEIWSEINDLKDWEEVGTLAFKRVARDQNIPEATPVPGAWREIDLVQKLVHDKPDFYAESGISVKNRAGQEIVLVAGANPCTIELSAPFYDQDFLPEYDLNEYQRQEI